MDAKIANRRKRDPRRLGMIVTPKRNSVLPRRDHDQIGRFCECGQFFCNYVDVRLAFDYFWPGIDWENYEGDCGEYETSHSDRDRAAQDSCKTIHRDGQRRN